MSSTIEPQAVKAAIELTRSSLKDAPALIEKVFPAQKISFEAQKERKSVQSQTLTGLGSYWKGRKPLILVRAILLGSLLPQTENVEQDLKVFEALMSFDLHGLARRAVAQNSLSPNKISSMIRLHNPWAYFSYKARKGVMLDERTIEQCQFPLDTDELGIHLSWKRGLKDDSKAFIYEQALATLDTYEARAALGKRPEEVDQEFLLAPAWPLVNKHLSHLGIKAHSMSELMEQLGTLRYGHRPRIGDTFAGGGSIPFEAARMGCDAYASDLNPIACMLNWGNFNIIGANSAQRRSIEHTQAEVARLVDEEITQLGIEHNSQGDRAKAYLYCLETLCPETGWMVPMATNWVISSKRKVIAKLEPDYNLKRFNIYIVNNASALEIEKAKSGTIQEGALIYSLKGNIYRSTLKTLRGDHRDDFKNSSNKLRKWNKKDFKPYPDDTFQERLYCIQWSRNVFNETTNKYKEETYFSSVCEEDLEREKKVESIVADHLASWQAEGLVPDMKIECGYNTTQPIRERGWGYWHHFFNARCLLTLAIIKSNIMTSEHPAEGMVYFSRLLDWLNKGCYYGTGAARESISHLFSNQALNTLLTWGIRSSTSALKLIKGAPPAYALDNREYSIENNNASDITAISDIWVTDPPYADAVNYHEITEFFIAWLRKAPPAPFNEWTWDSRRTKAIKGDGDNFRHGMIEAYKTMADHMPDNGMQCVMFTHQGSSVWSDMIGIFWAAGLQVVSAWYIATETTSELKKGGYVQGTVILMLCKRPAGDRTGFPPRIFPAVRAEVTRHIEEMLHLNADAQNRTGEPIFNDADLQMAGYAAALKVLTGYTRIGSEDVTTFALRPRQRGEKTVVDEIVEQASETANGLLVPDGLARETWENINGIQRFYLRMLDIETTGASKLDNYQNFAKAFRVADYTKVMGSITANGARLKTIREFSPRELMETTELGVTGLGQLVVAIQQLLRDQDIKFVVEELEKTANYFKLRHGLIDMARFIATRSADRDVAQVTEVLADRISNQALV